MFSESCFYYLQVQHSWLTALRLLSQNDYVNTLCIIIAITIVIVKHVCL